MKVQTVIRIPLTGSDQIIEYPDKDAEQVYRIELIIGPVDKDASSAQFSQYSQAEHTYFLSEKQLIDLGLEKSERHNRPIKTSQDQGSTIESLLYEILEQLGIYPQG